MRNEHVRQLVFCATVCVFTFVCGNVAAQIALEIDATEAPRRVFHVKQEFTVKPGPFALVYPKWIPGEHGPTGPIGDIVNLHMHAGERTVRWRRDANDLYKFHCTVPPGAQSLSVSFDYLSPVSSGNFTASPASTAQLAIIDWHLMLLYPDGISAADATVSPVLHIPEGWTWGGALPAREVSNNRIAFEPLSLMMLVDTPVIAGAYHTSVELTAAGETHPRHVLEIAADSEWALDAPESRIGAYRKLVEQTLALFGTWHYPRYHFLLTLTEHGDHFGLEHHMTSDNRMGETFLIDDAVHVRNADLLPHELFHSWNGKTFRPKPMIPRNYQQPIDSTGLWVYEGLTTYYGDVLAARAGLRTQEEAREALAHWAAYMDHVAGRQWRPLEDTTTAARILYGASRNWRSARRSVDFYLEGILIWLEADVLMRENSDNARSMDDFCRAFFGRSGKGEVFVEGYSDKDVFNALNNIVKHDWASFFYARLREPNEAAPLGGLEKAGWRLTYSNQPNAFTDDDGGVNALYSIGAVVDAEGVFTDVVPGKPLYEAGAGPGMRLVAVNGRKYTPTVLKKAMEAQEPMGIIVENADYFSVLQVDYTGGERYPHLVRVEDAPDRLSQILSEVNR